MPLAQSRLQLLQHGKSTEPARACACSPRLLTYLSILSTLLLKDGTVHIAPYGES